jgi:hypothetical protein
MPTVAPKALYGIYKLIAPHLSSMRIGGVVGDANHGSGYHISRSVLIAKGKTGDYSIQAPADKRGRADHASAIDITLSTAQMRLVTTRLRVACTDNDPRIEPIREFIGSLDGRNVCGFNRYKTGRSVGWYPSGYSDSSHQWHVHVSVFRAYCDDANRMKGLAEVIAGVRAGEFGWIDPTGAAVAPPPPRLPTYYVDPEKVSTVLLGHRGDDTPKERPPGFAITTGEVIVKDDGRQWLVTDAGWAYDLAYLTTVEPSPPTKPTTEPVPEPALRVAFWNTRRSSYEADHGTPRDWEHRDDLARDFLRALPGGIPDALLTCETTKDQTVDITKFTGLYGVGNGIGGHPKDVSGDNTAVFFSAEDLDRLNVVTVNTGTTSDPHERRFLTAVQVKVKATGATLWLAATHLNRGNTQHEKAREIKYLLREAKAAGVDLTRLVLGLDLNDPVLAPEMGVREGARSFDLVDIRELLTDKQFRGDSWDTFTGWTPEVEKTGRHIDAILIGSAIKVSRGEIVPVKNGASDHHLLLCSIEAK